jgi:hypothetical protein
MHRRQSPKVRDGRVVKKNNWAVHRGDYFVNRQTEIRLDRRDPGPGRRHLLTIKQLREFIALLPVWDEVAVDLDAIVLDSATDCMGWHEPGIVAICGWEQDLWWTSPDWDWVAGNRMLLDRIGVEITKRELRWTEAQARAWQLLDVLPHELGHHHDRITTHAGRDAARGEPYAEAYALKVLDDLGPGYVARYGI